MTKTTGGTLTLVGGQSRIGGATFEATAGAIQDSAGPPWNDATFTDVGYGADGAISNAISLANQTIRNMRWFEVVETRGQISDEKIAHWQVTIKIGFTLDA